MQQCREPLLAHLGHTDGGGGSLFCTNPVCGPFQLEPGALPVLRMLSVQSTCGSAHRVEDTQAPHAGGRARKGVRGTETSPSICPVCTCVVYVSEHACGGCKDTQDVRLPLCLPPLSQYFRVWGKAPGILLSLPRTVPGLQACS